PELLAFPGRDVSYPERERVAACERRGHQTRPRIACLLGVAAASSTASALAAAPGTNRGQRVVGRAVGIADAPLSLVRLLAERCARPADEGDALAVGRPRGTAVVIHAR